MAGGGKETPRQKMIGMMYLVLTALLALQVSNSVLDKFIFIDLSLQHTVKITREGNDNVLRGIVKKVQEAGNRDRDTKVKIAAETVAKKTNDLMSEISKTYAKIIEVSGGRTEDGKLAGAKDYDKQMAYTLGVPGVKGRGYELEKLMNDYASSIRGLHDSLGILPSKLALSGKEIDVFKNDPDQKAKDFAYLNFDHTPAVACLAVLSQMNAEIAQFETKALETLAKEVGADQIKFDNIIAVVNPESRIVAAGTKYMATMFIAASAKKITPKMTYNGNPLKVEDGKGIIEFTAPVPAQYDKDGKSVQKFKGCITVPRPIGDTTICIEEEFIVAKPVIKVESAEISALYLQCGNKLNISVPALGSSYDPRFEAAGAEIIAGASKGVITVIPNMAKVDLKVYSGGNYVGVESFKVKKVPLPTIKLFTGSKEVNMKEGFTAAGFPRSLDLKAIPEAQFKEQLPEDAKYRVTDANIIIGRGTKAVGQINVTSGTANLTALAENVKAGDRVVVEVKAIKRMNFRGKTEDVNMPTEFINIPIN